MNEEKVELKVPYASSSAEFGWSADYSKVKYNTSKFLQYPSDLNNSVQDIIPMLLSIECKHIVSISAFEDKKMPDAEFLGFMIPTLKAIRKIAGTLKTINTDDLSAEHESVVENLILRSSMIIKTLKEYEIDVAEKTMGA